MIIIWELMHIKIKFIKLKENYTSKNYLRDYLKKSFKKHLKMKY